ncbi:MAG TPA: TfoX/Sxy family protein [Planctomycetota bacterium]
MAFDEAIAARLRAALARRRGIEERRMFGGLAFLAGGHMACGVVDAKLMVRVGPDGHADALRQPHARPMDFTGKPLRGFVYVEAPGFAADADLEAWIARALEFVRALPPK